VERTLLWHRNIQTSTPYALVTGYYYEVVSDEVSHALRPFSDLLFVPIKVVVIRALWQIPEESTRAKQGETWREVYVNFA
jgi:hypothetical protein